MQKFPIIRIFFRFLFQKWRHREKTFTIQYLSRGRQGWLWYWGTIKASLYWGTHSSRTSWTNSSFQLGTIYLWMNLFHFDRWSHTVIYGKQRGKNLKKIAKTCHYSTILWSIPNINVELSPITFLIFTFLMVPIISSVLFSQTLQSVQGQTIICIHGQSITANCPKQLQWTH